MTDLQMIFTIVVSYFFIGCFILGIGIEDDPKMPQEAHVFIVLVWPSVIAIGVAVILATIEMKVANYVRSNKARN